MSTSSKNIKPILVGLTGGIGSGKTTVAKIFKAMGIPVFNSDDEAKLIVDNDKEVKQEITKTFGGVYNDGILNKKLMSELVFKDAENLKKLNAIIHPAVGKKFKEWVRENSNEPILIKEAAILIESDAYKEMDKLILVKASENTRINRVIKRNNISESAVRKRIQNQLSDKEKEKYCHYFIDNENQALIPQVLNITLKLT